MFRQVHRVQSIFEFLRERAPHYGPLARDDLHKFRDEIVRASVGASISAVAGLIFACFLSVAVIVSAWDGLHRTAVAWAVCCGWGVLALGGLLGGCDGAPSRNILGSYFPSWMVCALVGIALALAARAVFKASGLLEELPVPFVVMLAIACAGTFAMWLIWLS